MKKLPTLVVLILAVMLFAGCGGIDSATTTSLVGITTISSSSTTIDASATTVAGATSTIAGSTSSTTSTSATSATPAVPDVAMPIGQVQIDLTGDQMAPPVDTDASGRLVITADAGGIHYELSVRGFTADEVVSAGIYLATGEQGSAATTDTSGASGGSAQHQMVVDLLAGTTTSGAGTTSTAGTQTTAASDDSIVVAGGPLTEANLVGDLQGESVSSLLPMLLSPATQIYVQVATEEYPNGELRGLVDLQSILGGGAATTGTTETIATTPSTNTITTPMTSTVTTGTGSY